MIEIGTIISAINRAQCKLHDNEHGPAESEYRDDLNAVLEISNKKHRMHAADIAGRLYYQRVAAGKVREELRQLEKRLTEQQGKPNV